MNGRMWLVLGCVAVLCGCAGVPRSALPVSDVTGQQCRGFGVDIVVPDANTPQPELRAYGQVHITQGCRPSFEALPESGAARGHLWIVFGDLTATQCDAAATPFRDGQGNSVCRFRITTAASLRSKPHRDGVCTTAPGCHYWVVHEVPNGKSPYPPLDPHIIIIM
ncbi:MAG: hypothetical protein LC632_06720 [Xanthomonadaceae bacterium]|nr:hypothetical protein [Xanthomonadaceae bacterium]